MRKGGYMLGRSCGRPVVWLHRLRYKLSRRDELGGIEPLWTEKQEGEIRVG